MPTERTTLFIKQKTAVLGKYISRSRQYFFISFVVQSIKNVLQANLRNKKLFLKVLLALSVLIAIFLFTINHKNESVFKSTISYGKGLVNEIPSSKVANWMARSRANIPEWKAESEQKFRDVLNSISSAKFLLNAVIVDSMSHEIKAHTDKSFINKKFVPRSYRKVVESGIITVHKYRDNNDRPILHFSKSILYGKGARKKSIGKLHIDIIVQDQMQAIARNKIVFFFVSFLLYAICFCFCYFVESFFPERLHSGENILGPYILERKINQGGMAELFVARKKRGDFEMRVAIKKILPQWSKDSDFINSLIDEAKMLSRLQHPNIVSIHDCAKFGNTYVIDMDYIDGRDLAVIMVYCKEDLTVGLILYIISSVYKGLAYAHNKKDDITKEPLRITHSDISPHNILISYEGEVKIVDFGIAKARFSGKGLSSLPGLIAGKLSYMSPEQAKGNLLDSRSDIFSAGIIFYELLTGNRINRRKREEGALEFARNPKIKPIKDLKSDLSYDLCNIVMKTLENLPVNRYQTASEVNEAIEAFMYSLPEYMCDQNDMAEFMRRQKSSKFKMKKKHTMDKL